MGQAVDARVEGDLDLRRRDRVGDHRQPLRVGRAGEWFVEAAMGGDLEALLQVLAPDVTLWTDGGGKGAAASPHPVHGRDAVAHLLVGVTANAAGAFDIRYRHVNGDPSAVLFSGAAPFAVLVLDLTPAGDRVLGPDKLARITR
ncbi:nuclear transport factor 2 family protein [Amycolatopsis sp. NEAU-NG30]|uniref:Nuclear transport factor 2 family protein n=1 Tax=Amycolatopsis melonis TaxID=3156488 RepID=A0ABV0LSE2_9PSEU